MASLDRCRNHFRISKVVSLTCYRLRLYFGLLLALLLLLSLFWLLQSTVDVTLNTSLQSLKPHPDGRMAGLSVSAFSMQPTLPLQLEWSSRESLQAIPWCISFADFVLI